MLLKKIRFIVIVIMINGVCLIGHTEESGPLSTIATNYTAELQANTSQKPRVKTQSEEQIFQTSLNWLMESSTISRTPKENIKFEHAKNYQENQIQISIYALSFQESHFQIFQIRDEETNRELVFMIEKQNTTRDSLTDSYSSTRSVSVYKSNTALKNEVDFFPLISKWMKDGESYDEIKERLVSYTNDTEEARSYLLEFKKEKKMESVPDAVFYDASPEKIVEYLWKNFSYENDQDLFGKEDYWQSPDEMLKHGKGDCEDFALFAFDLLKRKGTQAFLVNIYGKKYAHTVVAFVHQGKFNVIDGHKLLKYNSETLLDLITRINPIWEKGALVAFSHSNHRGKILKMLDRPI